MLLGHERLYHSDLSFLLLIKEYSADDDTGLIMKLTSVPFYADLTSN